MSISQERILATEIPGPRSQALQARKVASVSAGVGTTLPVYVEQAGGGILRDVDGNQLIDFGSGIAVTTVGNAAPRVVEAVQRQVADFTHTCFMVTPYEEYVAVCEKLTELTPGDHEKRSALFNSGAEAVENAVKVARHHTGRDAIVVFDHAYHGRTNLTMALTAKNMPYKHRFGPFAGEVYRSPMAYPYRWPGGAEACADEAFEAFVATVRTQVGEDNCAAVLIEPIQGEGGFIVPPPGYLPRVAEWCRDHGILFIADEIQTGFARTGDWFACDHEGVVPDLVTTAKGMAGGLPLAAVTGRAEVMDSVHVGGLGGTYGGNPVACAAALAAIETMQVADLPARAREIEAVFLPRLRALAERHPDRVGDIRGRGAMLAVELVSDGAGRTPDAALAGAVHRACAAQGLVTLTCGTFGNVFRFLPPLAIGDDLVGEGLDVFEAAFDEAVGSVPSGKVG
jgi:4-aminobutyrate aminotransferase/(S)-3-amino-2-methylpropionate transaminase